MKLSKEELSIIEIALANDIKDQMKFLEKHGGDEFLEEYLHVSEKLHEKILKYLVV